MKKLLILIAVLTFNAAAFAQTTWNADKMHSKLQFTVTHLLVSDVDGLFKDFSASIVAAKPDFSDAKFTLTVNTASVNTEVDQRDAHLKSADFFDVANYPTMTFVSTGLTKTSANHYKLNGNLTLHGTTKPVVFDLWYRGTVTGLQGKPDAGFQITGVIKRSDFNFGSKFGNAVLSDEVTVKANGEFAKAE
ncbi:MAG TPA: YceI family protein [Mucilaginibacter sp.]|nr:YceI family protein [Mucilaginibacter sp.]